MIFKKLGFAFSLLALSFSLQGFSPRAWAVDAIRAQVDQSISRGRSKLGVGSSLTLKFPGKSQSVAGIFLGKLIDPSGKFNHYLVLDSTHHHVYLVGKSEFEVAGTSFQPVLRQYDQVDGTCTGYAIDHLLQQMYWSGFQGDGTLKEELSTEKGRTQLLVSAINEYYLVTQHRFSIIGILKKFAEKYGIKCEYKKFEEYSAAVNYLDKALREGRPVMVGFNIGKTMVESNYTISEYGSAKSKKDNRLWVPRKTGEKNGGGHAVVAVAAFEDHHQKKLLMLDSDWAEPRIWDVEKYLGGKTAIDEVEFYSCK